MTRSQREEGRKDLKRNCRELGRGRERERDPNEKKKIIPHVFMASECMLQ